MTAETAAARAAAGRRPCRGAAARRGFSAPQVRKVRFDGERMILVVNGATFTRELTWERLSPMSL